MAARRKRVEQRYVVDKSFQAWDLAKAGSALTIEVREHRELLGTIQIGQGSFRWRTARRMHPVRTTFRSRLARGTAVWIEGASVASTAKTPASTRCPDKHCRLRLREPDHGT
jgi:hypothetical protein